MNNIKIDINLDQLRRKLRKIYTYDEMSKFSGLTKTRLFNVLNNKYKYVDMECYIRLCLLAGIEPMDLITIEKY